jgi:hydroxymethylglutaryl-CoA synthase
MAQAGVESVLAKRERVSIEEYERIMRLASDAPEPLIPVPGEFRLAEIREHRRLYTGG